MRKILLSSLFAFIIFLVAAIPNQAHGQTPTPSQTLTTVKIGALGCSFKIVDGKYTQVISCESGGFCYFNQMMGGTFNIGTMTWENGLCISTQNKCPVCSEGYEYYFSNGKCVNKSNTQEQKDPIRTDTCQQNQGCSPGYGCASGQGSAVTLSTCPNGVCKTALGPLPTTIQNLLTTLFSVVLSLAGAVMLILIIISGYKLMLSQGNPEQIKDAREQLTAAIVGLLFIIFSLVILQIIGVDILKIPGFSR